MKRSVEKEVKSEVSRLLCGKCRKELGGSKFLVFRRKEVNTTGLVQIQPAVLYTCKACKASVLQLLEEIWIESQLLDKLSCAWPESVKAQLEEGGEEGERVWDGQSEPEPEPER